MLALLLILQSLFQAHAEECRAAERNDPLEVYLVTSGPGDGMYTRVGHSAIWVSGGNKKEAFFNWGAYDMDQKNFLYRFFMGTAQYKLTLMSKKRNDRRIEKNEHSKCERCWHRNETVGSVKDHPGLCSRCHENVYLNGEKRKLG